MNSNADKINPYFKEGKLYRFLSIVSNSDFHKFGITKDLTFLYLGLLPSLTDNSPNNRTVIEPCILLGSGIKVFFAIESDFNRSPERYTESID